jgi:hypothetical protein
MTAVMNNRKALNIKGKVEVIRQIENGTRKADLCLGTLSLKFCDPNDV